MPGFLEYSFTVQIFRGKFEGELFGPQSALGNSMREATEDVVRLAATLIGRNTGNLFSGHHPERGHLANSGKVVNAATMGSFGPGNIRQVSFLAVFDHEAASVHHNGAGAHAISPHGLVMKNPSASGGGIPATYLGDTGIFRATRTVEHPGHAANPYLTDAAAQIGLKASGALLRGQSLTPQFRSPKGFL